MSTLAMKRFLLRNDHRGTSVVVWGVIRKLDQCPVVDLRGARGTRAPLGVQILSISCSFWENVAKLYVGAPPGSWRPLLGEILDPPLMSVELFNCIN